MPTLLLSVLLACSSNSLQCSESQLISVFVDEDRDGYGDSAQQKLVCELGPQLATVGGDCDDTRSTVFPGGFEECDGLDNDCDGSVDEGLRLHTWYADEDGDGFGRPSRTAQACSAPPGFVDNDWDCHDDDPLSHPGAAEFCDGKDNNCDDLIDDEDPNTVPESMPTWYKDNDVDGFGGTSEWLKQCTPPQNGAWVKNSDDCDDANKAVNPNAPEICNEIDDDCDGHIDDSDASIDPAHLSTFWYDGDGDGFGDDGVFVQACDAPWFYVGRGGDCDDAEPNLQDASSGWWVKDNDGDGFGASGGAAQGPGCNPPGAGYVLQAYATDCDDASSAIFPGAVEICDSIDNDCNGDIDDADAGLDLSTASTFYADTDGDGFGDLDVPVLACAVPAGASANADDCDDSDADIHPNATEICNLGVDDDCDGLADSADPSLDTSSIPTWYFDFDFDGWGDPNVTIDSCDQPLGYVDNDIDCDDNDAAGPYKRPWMPDNDGDGFGAGEPTEPSCAPPTPDGWIAYDENAPLDCDDKDPDSWPGAEEICGDGIDQDCDGEDDACPVFDTCKEALAAKPLTTGFYEFHGYDLKGFHNDIDLSPKGWCSTGPMPGEEAIIPLRLEPGEVLTAALTSGQDMNMVLTLDCNDPDGHDVKAGWVNCLAGGDMVYGKGTENLWFHNSDKAPIDAYLILDCTSSCGQFDLDLEIVDVGQTFLPETCPDAQKMKPLTTGGYIIGGFLQPHMGDDIDMGNAMKACTGQPRSTGWETFVPLELQGGQVVYVWYLQPFGDGSSYLLRDCATPDSCVEGYDYPAQIWAPEEYKYMNPQKAPEQLYLGFDCNNPQGCGRYWGRLFIQ